MSDPLHPKTAAEAAEAWMRNVPADDPKMPEPVAWLVVNGWQPVAVHLASASASADRYRRQMSHDLSGSLSAHSTAPLITTEAAQAYAEALAAARVAQERKRCAQVCEEEICPCCFDEDAQAVAEHLADAIRTQPPETGKEPT